MLDRLTQAGLIIQAAGNRLIVRPKDRITDEVRQFIRDHKQEILAELSTPVPAPLYGIGDHIVFLGKRHDNILAGKIRDMHFHRHAGWWYRADTGERKVWVGQNNVVGLSKEMGTK